VLLWQATICGTHNFCGARHLRFEYILNFVAAFILNANQLKEKRADANSYGQSIQTGCQGGRSMLPRW